MLRSIPYPYLASSLLLLQILLVGMALGAGQRRLALLSGLLSVPFAMASVFFVPEYWSPVRLADFPAGPEDFIFSFATGGTAWLLAIWPLRARFTAGLTPSRFLGRYLICTVLGVTLSGVCWAWGMSAIVAAVVGISALWGALIWHRRELWPLSATGTIGFTLFYTAFVIVVSVVWPDLRMHWNADNLWGPRILMVPLEEIVWAVGYGAVWPLFMAYVFDTHSVGQVPHGRGLSHG
jgi:hypothetical protein